MDGNQAILPESSDGCRLLRAYTCYHRPVRPSQSAYVISDHLAHADPLVSRFDRWAREKLAQGFNLEHAADALAASKRTLARRLQDVMGKTPVSYVQDLRIERAVHLLKTSDQNIDRIAEQVGYRDGVTLRTAQVIGKMVAQNPDLNIVDFRGGVICAGLIIRWRFSYCGLPMAIFAG